MHKSALRQIAKRTSQLQSLREKCATYFSEDCLTLEIVQEPFIPTLMHASVSNAERSTKANRSLNLSGPSSVKPPASLFRNPHLLRQQNRIFRSRRFNDLRGALRHPF